MRRMSIPIFQALLWLAPLAVAIAAFALPALKNGLSEKKSTMYTYPFLASAAFLGVFFFLPALCIIGGVVATIALVFATDVYHAPLGFFGKHRYLDGAFSRHSMADA